MIDNLKTSYDISYDHTRKIINLNVHYVLYKIMKNEKKKWENTAIF